MRLLKRISNKHKNMKNNTKIIGSLLVTAVVAMAGSAERASAVPITGGITITSASFTPNNPNLTLATSLTINGTPFATSPTGIFLTLGL